MTVRVDKAILSSEMMAVEMHRPGSRSYFPNEINLLLDQVFVEIQEYLV
jgi:hypothetical protein